MANLFIASASIRPASEPAATGWDIYAEFPDRAPMRIANCATREQAERRIEFFAIEPAAPAAPSRMPTRAFTRGEWSFRPVQSNGRPALEIFRKGSRTWSRGSITQSRGGCYMLCVYVNGTGESDAYATFDGALERALAILNHGPRYSGEAPPMRPECLADTD